MEKYCKSCGRVFDDLNFKLYPYCGSELGTRYGRQPIPRKLRHKVFKHDGYRCRECGANNDETSLEIDHIIPVARGGTNDIDNLQTLCHECNRMKHTDEWIGGETDFETVKKELTSLKKHIKKAKNNLKQANNENDKIEYEYQIMKLEEMLPSIEKKYEKLYNEHKQIEAKRKKEEKQKRIYKKMYVKIDEEAYIKWSRDNSVPYKTKEQFIVHACTLSETKVNNYIYTIGSYKKLIDNPEKLSIYEKLYSELDYESQDILNKKISRKYKKRLLILNYLDKYNEIEIRQIIKKEKEIRHKKKQFELKQNKFLEKYRKYLNLSKTAQECGIVEEELFYWYSEGENGNSDYIEFYNKINSIKMPTPTDRKKMYQIKTKSNFSVAEKQKIVLEKLESNYSLDEAADYANTSVSTIRKWYEYGQKGMVEFSSFYKKAKKILKSKNKIRDIE